MCSFLISVLVACTGPDVEDDSDSLGATGDSSAENPSYETADTGDDWPDGIVGDRPWEPVPPLQFFVAEDLDGAGRGPIHLYDGTPTLLTIILDLNASAADTAGSALNGGRLTLEAAGVTSVVVTRDSKAEAISWVTNENLGDLDVWSDSDDELMDYYYWYSRPGRYPRSMLLDSEGVMVLVYDQVDSADDHVGDVVNDVLLLWAD